MTAVVGQTPYDLANLLKGPCRVLYAPISQAIPTKLKDIFAVEGEYKAAGSFKEFGATAGGGSYNRQFATSGNKIDQATGDVDQEVSDVVRSISAPFNEVTPELLQMMEGATSVGSVAAAAGYSAEKQVKTGTVESLTPYRIVIVGRRSVGQGADVVQKDGTTRGALVAYCMYRGKIVGDNTALQFARGQLASAPLGFQAYPEPGQKVGEEHGIWMIEQAGTIA
jgi:hypothetical protein